MNVPRRQFLRLAAGAGALPAAARMARAQAYPARPVRILVGFAAGGNTDIFARLLGQWLSERLGQPFIVENRPGAGTTLATEAVVKAAPDGYTLLLFSSSTFLSATLYDKLNFNFVRDIAPVASITRGAYVMLVNPSVSAKSIPELIAHAKANPGKMTLASAGTGSGSHVTGELFKAMTGIDTVHVPYRGDPPALTDLIGRQVDGYFSTLPPSIEYIRSGKLRALAVTTAARLEALPEIPTVGEFVPGFEASLWNGFGAPKGTPAEIVEQLNTEINAALVDPRIRARLLDLGATVHASSPAEYGKLIAEETEKWGKVIRAANIKPD
jgi:tripartite-type tricarboxylate transporter receptor subunit TctC